MSRNNIATLNMYADFCSQGRMSAEYGFLPNRSSRARFIRFLIMGTSVLLGFVCFFSLVLVVFNILIFLNKSAFLPLEVKRGHFLF